MCKSDVRIWSDKPVLLVGPANPDFDLLEKYNRRGFDIIAADGGANQLLAHGIHPRAIIGDLDSIDEGLRSSPDINLIRIDEQESTDFEKCLYAVEAPIYLALGFIGDRFDHTLANLHAMVKYGHDKNVVLVGPQDFSLVHHGRLSLATHVGDRVSIIALSKILFKGSTGLKYKLDGLALSLGKAIGTSNEAISDHISIEPDSKYLQENYVVTLGLDALAAFIASGDKELMVPL